MRLQRSLLLALLPLLCSPTLAQEPAASPPPEATEAPATQAPPATPAPAEPSAPKSLEEVKIAAAEAAEEVAETATEAVQAAKDLLPEVKVVKQEDAVEAPEETQPPETTPQATIFKPRTETTEPKKWPVKYTDTGDVKTPEEANWGLGPGAETEASTDPDASGDGAKEAKVVIVKTHRAEGAPSGPHTCFHCNSADDPKCADDRWDHAYAQDNFRQKCALNRPLTPDMADNPIVGCRKIYMHIGADTRVVRQCAFGGKPHVQGHKQVGSEGLKRWFYTCPAPDCNSAALMGPSALLLLTLWLLR